MGDPDLTPERITVLLTLAADREQQAAAGRRLKAAEERYAASRAATAEEKKELDEARANWLVWSQVVEGVRARPQPALPFPAPPEG